MMLDDGALQVPGRDAPVADSSIRPLWHSISCPSQATGQDDEASKRGVRIDVYDFFSGCGGTSAGLKKAGLKPVIAVDFDDVALATYKRNFPEAVTVCQDVRDLLTTDLEKYFPRERSHPVLICACAPCQPFSAQNRHKRPKDARVTLLGHLRRFVERFRPEMLLVENVPGIGVRGADEASPLAELRDMLDGLGYHYDVGVLMAHDYGVPQARRRLLVAASLLGPIALPQPTHGSPDVPHLTVRDAIGRLPALVAGGVDPEIPGHKAASLSTLNLQRIRASRPGGSWNDWPAELRLNCHRSVDGYTDVYGRLHWDRPAPALTTRCISYSNGRYGHPEQDRAISVREAACLQTFDPEFEFVGNLAEAAKQIGNAVPVRLAEVLGQMFQIHASDHLRVANG